MQAIKLSASDPFGNNTEFYEQKKKVIEAILNANPDLTHKNNEEKTALDLAESWPWGEREIAPLIRKSLAELKKTQEPVMLHDYARKKKMSEGEESETPSQEPEGPNIG